MSVFARMTHVGFAPVGIVPTKFAGTLVADENLRQEQENMTFLGRLGTVEDMASAVAYLCSNEAGYITGECLLVAGGQYAKL